MDAARQKMTRREANGKQTPGLAVGRQERRRRTVRYTSTKQAVECVFDQICSFGLYIIRYVMFLCFQVHFRTKQTKSFLAYVMLNIICLYVFMFSGMLQYRIIFEFWGQYSNPSPCMYSYVCRMCNMESHMKCCVCVRARVPLKNLW